MIRRTGLVLPLALTACGLTLLGCSKSTVEAAPEVASYDARTFYQTTSLYGASFSADEANILFTSDESGIFNAWSVPVAGGEARQLTDSQTDAISAVGFFPADERFLYTADQGGNELNHLYLRTADDRVIDLTPGENLKARFAGWEENDRAFFVLTNERDPRFFDLYRYEVPDAAADEYPRERIFENPGGFNLSDVSPDGRWLALNKVRNNVDSDVYVLDLLAVGAEPRHVTPHEGNISHGVDTFTPDSKQLYYSSNEGSEFNRVWSYALVGGEKEVVAEADWDVTFVAFSRGGRYRVTGVNADARTEVTISDLQTGKDLELPELPRGDLRGVRFSRSENKMAFYVNGDTSPSNLFVLDIGTGDLTQLTSAMNPAMDAGVLVDSVVVRYTSFDGQQIPALLYRPRQATAGAPVPALVWVHGGPGGQCRTGYNPMIQHLVNQGYGILAVNNRGSSGYGKTFFHMDDRRHGDVDLQDCVFGRRYLETLEWVDGEKIGIIGGSYGGYMVVAALAFEPEAFDIGIDIFGVTNWVRTLSSIPPYWEDFKESLYAEMGDPQTDEERLTANSPLFHADNIKRPLLVVQGANDPRVLKIESDELVQAVKANGVPVEYKVFPDEGHGFRRRENRITASEAYVKFADRHLKGRAADVQ